MINDSEAIVAALSDMSTRLDGTAYQSHLEKIAISLFEMSRPSVLYRPRLFVDGDQYCLLLGENLQEGVAGFGDTPELAADNFDEMWFESTIGPAKVAPGEVKGG